MLRTHTPTIAESIDHDLHGAPGKVRSETDNSPPNSRLFVLCDKASTEDEILKHFAPFGTVEYCKIIRDRQTQASKGYCYVKFTKASGAADALEKADGTVVAGSEFPIKVEIAQAKSSRSGTMPVKFSSEPEDTPPRSRLFVVCPKEMSERQLASCFAQFADFEYGKVIVDKATGFSKGFAYVKFHKASSAAIALEAVNERGEVDGMRVKVLIADPKAKRRDAPDAWPFTSQWDAQQDSLFVPSGYMPPFHPMEVPSPCFVPYMVPPVMQVHFVVECDSSASYEDLQALFTPFDGFETCQYTRLPQPNGTLKGIAHVYFTDPQRAMVAVEKVNGSQVAGSPVKCSWEEPLYPSPAAQGYYPIMLPPYSYYPPPPYPYHGFLPEDGAMFSPHTHTPDLRMSQ